MIEEMTVVCLLDLSVWKQNTSPKNTNKEQNE